MLVLTDQQWAGFEVFNVGTEDHVTVREIADMVVERLALENVEYSFTGGSRGWKGDVPVVRLDTRKIRARGWSNRYSARDALADSIESNITEVRREVAAS
jgi:UDP-glucose 4-epimerase